MQGQNTEDHDQDNRLEPTDQVGFRNDGVNREFPAISYRRKVGAVLFGVFYGGTLLNGVEEGLTYILKTEDYVLGHWPFVESLVQVTSGALAGLFAGYLGRSLLCGGLAGGILAALSLAIAYWFGADKPFWLVQASGMAVFGAGAFTASLGSRLPISATDVAKGRVFGVSWKHWLWLHIPWQLMIATAVSAAYPISLMMESSPGWWRLGWDIIRAPLYVGMIIYAALKALESLHAESPFSRTQTALRFLWWFLVFPVLVNLLRLADL